MKNGGKNIILVSELTHHRRYGVQEWPLAISLCQVTSHSRELNCLLGIAAIYRVSKPRCSGFGEWSFSFASK